MICCNLVLASIVVIAPTIAIALSAIIVVVGATKKITRIGVSSMVFGFLYEYSVVIGKYV